MLTLDAGAQGAALLYATCLALAVNVLYLVRGEHDHYASTEALRTHFAA